jgi:hypothetical protein
MDRDRLLALLAEHKPVLAELELLLEHQPRVLAQRVELDLRPVVLHGAQLAGVFQQHGGRVHRVQRHAVALPSMKR